jgi:hypothetical protein
VLPGSPTCPDVEKLIEFHCIDDMKRAKVAVFGNLKVSQLYRKV